MNRRALWVGLMLLSLVWIAGLGGCDGCGSSRTVNSIAATSGGGQSTQVLTTFANPLAVTVTNSSGTGVSGVVVTFTAPAQTGASATFAGGVNTATTGANGVATSMVVSANAIAGGPYTVVASIPGGASANFSLTNTPGPAAGINCTSGTPQSTAINTPFTNTLGVQIVDAEGNSVMTNPGFVVTFTAPAQTVASATFAGGVNTATTGANGAATSQVVSANGIAGGPYNVTASVGIGDATPTCNFVLTNTDVPASISVTSGSGQSTAVNTLFLAPLVATVLNGASNPVSGVVVTFTAPAQTGASATFAGGVNTATTDVNGVATSQPVSANGTAGGPYTVAATVSGVAAPANFMLTNTAAAGESFSFYVTGLEAINNSEGPNFYAVAGAFTIDMTTGAVTAGEQDYNDAFGITSPEPSGDSITGGQLTVNATTGQGTLTLVTNNTLLGGVNTAVGTEEFAVTFVNANHALISQFDGSATSSGSLDLQTLTMAEPSVVAGTRARGQGVPSGTPVTFSGPFSFTMSGVDSDYDPVIVGGVFSVTGAGMAGTFDVNDDGAAFTQNPFTATVSVADSFGRGTITNSDIAGIITINYYIVRPEAVRMIDVDQFDSAVGSAFGQGSGTFSNASLGSSVFSLISSSWGSLNAAVGQFSTSNTSSSPASFSGVGDDNEIFGVGSVSASPISGTYSINIGAINGYGSLAITNEGLGSFGNLGVYMTDPNLNINDPNNNITGLGGALVADMDDDLAGVTGVLVPQTDPSTASFDNAYAGQAQAFVNSEAEGWETDVVGSGTALTGATVPFSGFVDVSDPFFLFSDGAGPANTYSAAALTGTAVPDVDNVGRYTMFTPNPFAIDLPSIGTFDFAAVVYQASGDQLFWVDEDETDTFGGPLEQQFSTPPFPLVKAKAAPAAKLKK
jgi:hypothetical protein